MEFKVMMLERDPTAFQPAKFKTKSSTALWEDLPPGLEGSRMKSETPIGQQRPGASQQRMAHRGMPSPNQS